MIPVTFCFSVALIISGAIAFDVIVTTNPEGPSYKAGSLFSVICSTVGIENNHFYQWSFGCSYTGIFTNYVTGASTISYYATTTTFCRDIYRCKVNDLTLFTSVVGQVTIETVTDIAIQLLLSPNFVYIIQNISILTVSASGQFIDVICNTGLKQPNIGQWINPNGTDIAFDDETLEIQRGGGIVSLPYTTLKLRDGYSLDPQDTGLYTCKMPDINMVERESHIWILPEQDFKPADPEYFTSYSGQNSLKMICAYSNTPGEIIWYNHYYSYLEDIAANDKTKISQRLTQSSPAIYEGVLELDYIDVHLIAGCTMYSSIIKDPPDEYHETIYADHYFFLSWIGQPESFSCSLGVSVVISQVYTNGQLLNTVNGSNIVHTIDIVMDVTHNQEYNCIGITLDNQKSYVNITIVGLIPAFPLTMHIIAIDPVITAGEPLTIDLIAIKNSGFTYDQTISCTDDNGVPINDLEGFMYPNNPKTTGLTLHYEVPIEMVTLSHAGLYLCTAFLETPSQLDNISDNNSFAIRVIAPEPDLIHINSMEDEAMIILIAGTIALFNCTATLDTEFVDTPVSSVVHWMIGDTPLIESHDRFNILTETTSEDMNDTIAFYSQLEIAPVLLDDKGVLECRVFITDNSSNEYILDSPAISSSVNLNIEGSEALASQAFQLLLSGLDTVAHSSKLNSIHYLDLITNEIVTILMLKCNCQYSNKYIKQQHFIIQTEHSTGLVTYRAILYGTNEIAATTLIEYIQDWINTDGLLLTETEGIITVDENCELVISSFNSILCDNLDISATTPASSPSPIASESIRSTSYAVSYTTQILNDHTASSANTETIAVNSTDNSGSQLLVMLLLIVGICGILVCFLIIICFLGLTLFITMKKNKKRKQEYVTHGGQELYQEISNGLPNDYEMYTRKLPNLPNTEDNDLKKKLHNSDIDSEIYMEMAHPGSDTVAEEIYDTETTYEYIEQHHISDCTEL